MIKNHDTTFISSDFGYCQVSIVAEARFWIIRGFVWVVLCVDDSEIFYKNILLQIVFGFKSVFGIRMDSGLEGLNIVGNRVFRITPQPKSVR